MTRCDPPHPTRRIVLTGGPGAGKTAVLEVVRKGMFPQVAIVPEAASILYGGGFPRGRADVVMRAGQRAIYHVQRELERLVDESDGAGIALCDRGTLDGLAYWPGDPAEFLHDVETTRAQELARYASVIHLRVPRQGYNHDQNPLRIETAIEALAIDERIARAWDGHPRRTFVEATPDFLTKIEVVLGILRLELPPCCTRRAA